MGILIFYQQHRRVPFSCILTNIVFVFLGWSVLWILVNLFPQSPRHCPMGSKIKWPWFKEENYPWAQQHILPLTGAVLTAFTSEWPNGEQQRPTLHFQQSRTNLCGDEPDYVGSFWHGSALSSLESSILILSMDWTFLHTMLLPKLPPMNCKACLVHCHDFLYNIVSDKEMYFTK